MQWEGMMKKEYSTNGYVTHKKIFISFLCFWFSCAVIALVARFSEILHMERKALSLFPLVILFMVTAYMVYMIKKTKITLAVDDSGITYESASRKGFLFYRTSRFIPWNLITAITIIDKNKGPMKIDATDSDIVYWNIVNPKENYDLYDDANRRIQSRDQR